MKNLFLLLVTMTAGFVLMPGSASAHHGYAAFDTSAEVTLKGTVTDFHFTNPHCVVEFDVKDDKGQVQNWKAELTSANHLVPKGWTETTVQAGDELAITGYRAKNGAPSLWVNKIRMANGQEIKLDSAN
jgi:Family of unknown function (DUF6152)